MQDNESLRSYYNDYIITADYFTQRQDQIDLTQLLYNILQTSGDHDAKVKATLDDYVISDDDVWVITQAHWQINAWPLLGEEIRIETSVTKGNKFLIQRYFTVKTLEGDLLIEAWIQFAAINFKNRHISEIKMAPLKALGMIDKSHAYRFVKLKLPEDIDKQRRLHYPINKSDIDGNQHVNNRVYLKWCLQAFDDIFLTRYDVSQLDIKYGQELRFDDEVELITSYVKRQSDEQPITYQVIKNVSKGHIACEVMIKWN